ncbi:adenosylcobinamide-GDP ribazoletransferase [Sphingomonas sp. Mn802worker]|uniref:adenosylcobinamide-GDP ribazoletransferase n=1 Tax=Sphingomonas sp. Mn802worker TaxID=629773 RepID=UPI0004775E36|nr:adenosylcobinamide-GDP ribazoletransferase [Sphingomonas sp. Mn802worker]
MRRLIVALSFLTRLPVPRQKLRDGDFAASVRLYPLVGAIVGSIVAGLGWAGALIDPWLGALAAVLGWVWVTGALHLDGLADMSDGLGAAHGDRSRLLAVMSDPHVGSFGVVAIVLQLAAKLVMLHLILPGGWLAVVLIPVVARLGPLGWARFVPLLKASGLGAAITGAVRRRDLVGWVLVLLGASVPVPSLLLAPVVLAVLGVFFTRRVGGMTGDVHGAGIELTETMLLLACVVDRWV